MSAAEIHRLVKLEKWPQAWALVNAALNDDPESPELLYLAGSVLRPMGNIGMALPLFAKALSKARSQPNLWMHYGATLHDLNLWPEAIDAFKVVAKMLPQDPMPLANIGAAKVQMGKWQECIEYCDKALALDPECYIAHISKHFACLALGNWAEGWEHGSYLYGRHLHVRVYNLPENEEPEWDGAPGKTVVVQCDQGIGDIIMYGQCLPEMIRDCKEVILECAERMVPAMKRNFPGCTVYGTLKQAGQDWARNHQIDAHCHISALPKFYRRTGASFPRVAYIKPDEAKVAKWRDWLKDMPRPWIGVSWKGGLQQTQKHLRSLQLDQLAPVLNVPGSFIDLSYRDHSREIAEWNIRGKSQVIRPPIDEDDYEDTMALLWALDEVVTVTTAVVDACGAMGRTCRVLLPERPMWRYAYECGDGAIWYPENSLHLYRRKKGEAWESAIKRVANDVRPRVLLAA